jgi:alpha-tubulin suppressor-like RCC1 family protein
MGLGSATGIESIPVEVFDSTAGVVDFTINYYTSCAVINTGKVFCAGTSYGELFPTLGPIGDTTYSFTEMPGLSGVSSISGSFLSSIVAVLSNGNVVSWGYTNNDCSRSVGLNILTMFSGGTAVKAVAQFFASSFTKTDGSLWVLGERLNKNEPLTLQCSTEPVRANSAKNIQKFSALGYGFVWLSDGVLWFDGSSRFPFRQKNSESKSLLVERPDVVEVGVTDFFVGSTTEGYSNQIATICFLKDGDVFCLGNTLDFVPDLQTNTHIPRQLAKLYKNDRTVFLNEFMGIMAIDGSGVLRNIQLYGNSSLDSDERQNFGTFDAVYPSRARTQWIKNGNLYEAGYTETLWRLTGEIIKSGIGLGDLKTGVKNDYWVSCYVHRDGTVWCWGSNSYKQLGDGTTTERSYPTQSQMTNAIDVGTASDSVCALKEDKTVWCWGSDVYGQRGDGPTTSPNAHIPSQVKQDAGTFLTDVKEISAGHRSHCALKEDGSLWCWGRNHLGTLCVGDNSNRGYATLVTVGGSTTNVKKQILGGYNNYIITKTNKLYSCGDGVDGSIGDGFRTTRTSPVLVNFTTPNVSSIAIGSRTICYLDDQKVIWCVGNNRDGTLGTGEPSDNGSVPVNPKLMWSDMRQISAGESITCGVLWDKSLFCMGNHQFGKLGSGVVDPNWPVKVKNMEGETALVSTKTDHVCALKENGSVYCWGKGRDGQLGNGSHQNQSQAVQIDSSSVFIDVSVGTNHSCAVKNDGTVWCWGGNSDGQLGDGKTVNRNRPVQVTGISSVARVSLGDRFSCALKNDNTVYCWGLGTLGTLGNDKYHSSKVPLKSSITGVAYLSAGIDHVCAVKSNGSAWCWGNNANGKIGLPSSKKRTASPVAVSTVTSLANSISSGQDMSCVTKTDGTMTCWGKTAGMTFWD